jgi:hypothetical protein
MSRAVVKVRVSSLEDIPWFFVFTKETQFESNSWSVQCEILQATLLGGAPEDEGFPPDDDDDFDPYEFHFHGFRQPGQGPPEPAPINIPFQPNQEVLNAMGSVAKGRGAGGGQAAPNILFGLQYNLMFSN